MCHRIFARQKVTPEDFTIRAVDVAIVPRQKPVTVRAVQAWQVVPANARMHVMHHMQVVVEEEKRQKTTVFDNYGTRLTLCMGAMFEKSADSED